MTTTDTSGGNILVGINSGRNLDGDRNTSVGWRSSSNLIGRNNAVYGVQCMRQAVGSFNTSIGDGVGIFSYGNSNIMIGKSAGASNGVEDPSDGSSYGLQDTRFDGIDNNILIGNWAGQTNRGAYNIIIGSRNKTFGGSVVDDLSHQIKIGSLIQNVNNNVQYIVANDDPNYGHRALHLTNVEDTSGTGIWIQGLKDTSNNNWYIGHNSNDTDKNLYFIYDDTVQVQHDVYPNIGSEGTSIAYIDIAGSTGALNFTGQHRSSGEAELYNYVGYIVRSTGVYRNLSGDENEIGINEALPVVELASVSQDKAVFGVISSGEEKTNKREYALGNFVSVYDRDPSENRLIINSVGEGAIWVCNINGNLENGDYITTCDISGLGAKQGDDILHNYTVAKITMDCDFSRDSWYQTKEVEYGGVTYIAAFVGCTYHCG
jgi:hypothetical protein